MEGTEATKEELIQQIGKLIQETRNKPLFRRGVTAREYAESVIPPITAHTASRKLGDAVREGVLECGRGARVSEVMKRPHSTWEYWPKERGDEPDTDT